MKRICLIAWLIAFSCPTEAKEYHVAKEGNDQNPGSASAPFQNITAAASMQNES